MIVVVVGGGGGGGGGGVAQAVQSCCCLSGIMDIIGGAIYIFECYIYCVIYMIQMLFMLIYNMFRHYVI